MSSKIFDSTLVPSLENTKLSSNEVSNIQSKKYKKSYDDGIQYGALKPVISELYRSSLGQEKIVQIVHQYLWEPALDISPLFQPYGKDILPLSITSVECFLTLRTISDLAWEKFSTEPYRHHFIAMIEDTNRTRSICDAEALVALLFKESPEVLQNPTTRLPIRTIHYFQSNGDPLFRLLSTSYKIEEQFFNKVTECRIYINSISVEKETRVAIRKIMCRAPNLKNNELIRLLKLQISDDPKDIASHVQLGDALLLCDAPNDAIPYLKTAIELDPRNVAAYISLGDALRLYNKTDEAISYLNIAIQLDPNNASAYAFLGDAFRKQNKWEEAERYFQKALTFDPKQHIAHAGIGFILQQRNELEEAEIYFKKAIELYPTNSFPYTCLGTVLQKRNKLEEAEKCFRKAITVFPKKQFFYTYLGKVLQQFNKLEEAEECFKKAVELPPEDSSTHEYSKYITLFNDKNMNQYGEKIQNNTLKFLSSVLHNDSKIIQIIYQYFWEPFLNIGDILKPYREDVSPMLVIELCPLKQRNFLDLALEKFAKEPLQPYFIALIEDIRYQSSVCDAEELLKRLSQEQENQFQSPSTNREIRTVSYFVSNGNPIFRLFANYIQKPFMDLTIKNAILTL